MCDLKTISSISLHHHFGLGVQRTCANVRTYPALRDRIEKRHAALYRSNQNFLEKTDDIKRIAEAMEECRVQRNTERMESLWQHYCQRYPQMHDPHITSLAIDCYLQASFPQLARKLLLEAVSQGYHPSLAVLESVIAGLLWHSDETNALSIYNSLSQYGLKPQVSTQNIWIWYHLREQQPDKARQAFRSIESLSLIPNQTTYLHFLSHFIYKNDQKSVRSIREYMRASSVKIDVRLYNGLLKAYFKRQAIPFIEELIEEMKKLDIKFDSNTFEILISGYSIVGKYEKVDCLLEEMISQGFRPTVGTFNRILSSYSLGTDPSLTTKLLKQMDLHGLTFNGYTYASLITNLVKQGRSDDALQMLSEAEKKNVRFTIDSYSALIRLFCKQRIEPGIVLLCIKMANANVQPTMIIYSHLIQYYLRKRNYTRVDALLLEMQRKWGLQPNTYVLTTMLNHFVEALDWKRIDAVLNIVRLNQVHITGVMYNVLMKVFYSYSRYHQGGYIERLQGISNSIAEYKDLKDISSTEKGGSKLSDEINACNSSTLQDTNTADLENESDQLKNVHSDVDILGSIDCGVGPVNEDFIGESKVQFSSKLDHSPLDLSIMKQQFESLFQIPFRPTVDFYNEIMLTFFVRENYSRIKNLILKMKEEGIVKNLLTYTIIVKTYTFAGEIEEARKTLLEMAHTGLRPTLIQCAVIMHAYCRSLETEKAESFLVEMARLHQVTPNHVFYASLLYSYCKKREYSTVFKVFSRMELAGFQPDTETCNYVLLSLFEIGEYGEAATFFQKMIDSGIPRNSYSYNYFCAGMISCDQPIPQILKIITEDCIVQGNVVNTIPFNDMMRVLNETNIDEADAENINESDTDELPSGSQQIRIMNSRLFNVFVSPSSPVLRQIKDKDALIIKVLSQMIQICVPYTQETVPFITYVFDKFCNNPSRHSELASILKKAIVDLGTDGDVFYTTIRLHLLDLVDRLENCGRKQESEAIKESFLKPEYISMLRREWTELSPLIIERFGQMGPALLGTHGGVDIKKINEATEEYMSLRIDGQENGTPISQSSSGSLESPLFDRLLI